MTDPHPGPTPPKAKRAPGPAYAGLGVLVLVVLILIAAYALRRSIGASLAASYLRSHGVESAIAVDRLTPTVFPAICALGGPAIQMRARSGWTWT
jgi:hypothetical protein